MPIKVGENTGGKAAIHRLIAAYNFKSRQQLCNHLGASKSTMANRYLRDSFPAEWVIQCAMETGASLLWLTTGEGESRIQIKKDKNFFTDQISKKNNDIEPVALKIDTCSLNKGSMSRIGKTLLDQKFLTPSLQSALLIHTQNESYIVDLAIETLSNGYYLVDIDGIKSIANLIRLPKNRLMVQHDDSSFECAIDDINVEGRVTKLIKSI